ncbi:efflux RND transporter periplasmic adaptor subunit [Brassicibacter mesophilus]|uniref:efflux RND transporter periplasmic adaptor subunit n=1 Tax=Brassicibacter mesophilus TaxID=745119 RepID=UPI003D19C0DB
MRKLFYLTIILTLLCSNGCSDTSNKSAELENIKPVAVEKLNSETFPILLEYIGTLQSKQIKKYSFKSSGKIAKIPVANGQLVNKGDMLAELDSTELKLAAKASESQMNAAKALYDKAVKGASDEEIDQAKLNVKKAKDAYDFSLSTYEKVQKLYDSGSISKQKLDESKLQLDNSETNLKLTEEILSQATNGSRAEDKQAAYAQYQQAKASYEAQEKLVEDTQLKADVNGYVVNVLYEIGEMAPAGHPVVVIRTDGQIINVGLSQQDIKKIDIGTEVNITIDDTKIKGLVSLINNVIDNKSRTYNVEIAIDDSYKSLNLPLGSIANVSFIMGSKNGVWVPISYISNDGQDYVYVVEDNRVVRKNIIIKNIYQDKVLVDGLKSGDLLITKGIKNVKEGYKVVVQQQIGG